MKPHYKKFSIAVTSLTILYIITALYLHHLPTKEVDKGSPRVYVAYGTVFAIAAIIFIIRLVTASVTLTEVYRHNPKRMFDLALYILLGTAFFLAIIFGYMFSQHIL